MPVDIDDTTKLSEEQRKFCSISTGSPSRRRRKTSTTFDLPIYPTNCAYVSSATSGKHTLCNRWAKILDEKFVENSKEDLFPPSCSFFKFLFDRNVHRDGAIFSMHAQHMIVMQRRTGAPHSLTRPWGAERAPDPWVEVDREGARARYRCLQRVTSPQSGVTSSPLLASKLDVNRRLVFLHLCFCIRGMRNQETPQPKKKKSAKGWCVRHMRNMRATRLHCYGNCFL